MWIVVGALVGAVGAALWQRLDAAPMVVVAGEDAEAPTRLARPVSDRQRTASQRTAKALNSRRVRCLTCGLESAPGPMGGHLKASGHGGTEPV